MPHGKCDKCGKDYYGWAIIHGGSKEKCDKCGGNIIIVNKKTVYEKEIEWCKDRKILQK